MDEPTTSPRMSIKDQMVLLTLQSGMRDLCIRANHPRAALGALAHTMAWLIAEFYHDRADLTLTAMIRMLPGYVQIELNRRRRPQG